MMRIGIAHHLGWAIAVTADDDHVVVDRRRIELVDASLPNAPIHHVGGPHAMHMGNRQPIDDDDLEVLVAKVRASAVACTAAALDALDPSVVSISLRSWPEDFPTDVATLRRSPYESHADSVMYRQVLADDARRRGWAVHYFDAATVEAEAAARLGARADDVLVGPRKTLGPPWAKDHRMALAATVLAG